MLVPRTAAADEPYVHLLAPRAHSVSFQNCHVVRRYHYLIKLYYFLMKEALESEHNGILECRTSSLTPLTGTQESSIDLQTA